MQPLDPPDAVIGMRVSVEEKGTGTLIGWKFSGECHGDSSGAPRTADDYFRINLDNGYFVPHGDIALTLSNFHDGASHPCLIGCLSVAARGIATNFSWSQHQSSEEGEMWTLSCLKQRIGSHSSV
jgi:hypothetical protein